MAGSLAGRGTAASARVDLLIQAQVGVGRGDLRRSSPGPCRAGARRRPASRAGRRCCRRATSSFCGVVEGAERVLDGARAGDGEQLVDVGLFGVEPLIDPGLESGGIVALHPGVERVGGWGGLGGIGVRRRAEWQAERQGRTGTFCKWPHCASISRRLGMESERDEGCERLARNAGGHGRWGSGRMAVRFTLKVASHACLLRSRAAGAAGPHVYLCGARGAECRSAGRG